MHRCRKSAQRCRSTTAARALAIPRWRACWTPTMRAMPSRMARAGTSTREESHASWHGRVVLRAAHAGRVRVAHLRGADLCAAAAAQRLPDHHPDDFGLLAMHHEIVLAPYDVAELTRGHSVTLP